MNLLSCWRTSFKLSIVSQTFATERQSHRTLVLEFIQLIFWQSSELSACVLDKSRNELLLQRPIPSKGRHLPQRPVMKGLIERLQRLLNTFDEKRNSFVNLRLVQRWQDSQFILGIGLGNVPRTLNYSSALAVDSLQFLAENDSPDYIKGSKVKILKAREWTAISHSRLFFQQINQLRSRSIHPRRSNSPQEVSTHNALPETALGTPLNRGALRDAGLGEKRRKDCLGAWSAIEFLRPHSENVFYFSHIIDEDDGRVEGSQEELDDWRVELAALCEDVLGRVLCFGNCGEHVWQVAP